MWGWAYCFPAYKSPLPTPPVPTKYSTHCYVSRGFASAFYPETGQARGSTQLRTLWKLRCFMLSMLCTCCSLCYHLLRFPPEDLRLKFHTLLCASTTMDNLLIQGTWNYPSAFLLRPESARSSRVRPRPRLFSCMFNVRHVGGSQWPCRITKWQQKLSTDQVAGNIAIASLRWMQIKEILQDQMQYLL